MQKFYCNHIPYGVRTPYTNEASVSKSNMAFQLEIHSLETLNKGSNLTIRHQKNLPIYPQLAYTEQYDLIYA